MPSKIKAVHRFNIGQPKDMEKSLKSKYLTQTYKKTYNIRTIKDVEKSLKNSKYLTRTYRNKTSHTKRTLKRPGEISQINHHFFL